MLLNGKDDISSKALLEHSEMVSVNWSLGAFGFLLPNAQTKHIFKTLSLHIGVLA
jgi:hypothetical protein